MRWIFLVIGALWLWWPRYDLEVALEPGPSGYEVVTHDFYTLGACREAAGQWRAYDWVCLEKTGWGQLFNRYSTYNKKVR